MKGLSVIRIRILSVVVLGVAGLLLSKLYLVQIVQGETFRESAERQYVRPSQNIFDRGTISFTTRSGDQMVAATVKSGFMLVANPKLLQDPKAAYEQIAEIAAQASSTSLSALDEQTFIGKASKKNDAYEELAKRLDENAAEKIQALKIPGIQLVREKWRYYPAGKSAAHVIGLVGYKGDTLAGRYGLENSYESLLRRSSTTVYVNFFAEIFSGLGSAIEQKDQDGDIITTIEPSVQDLLDKKVAEIQNKYSSDVTGAIVIDPKTGEVVAMSAQPNFDPNSFQGEKDVRVFSNPLVENVFEMGSIIKTLTMSAGIDAGVVTAQTTYEDPGFVILDKKRIANHDNISHGLVSMQEVLNQSLNTGVIFVMQKMGIEKFSSYMKNFGLGELTGIDLPNEVKGLVKNLDSTRQVEHATASFGQGIALTPIAVVRALSAVANGGYLPNPHVVKRIEYKGGYSKDIEIKEGRRVISKHASEETSRMLTALVDKALRKGAKSMLHYSIAAKTGTAQIAQPGGGYYDDRYLHSFFGYFPSYNPRFLVFYYTVNPKGVSFASETLTDPFFDTAKFLIHYYEIPPDR